VNRCDFVLDGVGNDMHMKDVTWKRTIDNELLNANKNADADTAETYRASNVTVQRKCTNAGYVRWP
jgi:hypothetical protein